LNTDGVILVESVIDSLVLWSVGIRSAIPIYGTNGLSDEIIGYLKEHRIREAVLMLDADRAGREAAAAIAEKLASINIASRIVELPAKDPSEYITSGGTVEELRSLISRPSNDRASQQSIKIEKRRDDSIRIRIDEREYSIRGLSANGLDRMKVNIRLKSGESFHIDTIDLYQDSARMKFAQKAAKQTGGAEQKIESDLVDMLDQLEAVRLEMRSGETASDREKPMTADEHKSALDYLKSPDLVERIAEDVKRCGLIGESATVLVGYLACISRKLSKPLSALIAARTGAGKSSLQDALCAFVPPEDAVWVTRLTGQALFYKDPNSLKGKVLAIAEEEGAAQAVYSLRTLASDQRLSIAVTQTNPQTGELHTRHYEIAGPVSIITTTTSPEAFDEETRSRFVLLTMDESREQTQAVLERQRRSRTLEGALEEAAAERIRTLHQNAQRLIRPLKIVNPYVEHLSYPAEQLTARREQNKYLTLIDAIALLHQHQREIKRANKDGVEIDYVEVELEDVALANELAAAVLWRGFDEMAPPTRGLLRELARLYEERAAELGIESAELALSRRQIREATGWSDWQVRIYCQKLVDMEYLYQASSGNGKPSLYKLIHPIEQMGPSLKGLTDVEQLKKQLNRRLKRNG
jgi:5S rRNA maturation endonuclease (ribonuclease M5)